MQNSIIMIDSAQTGIEEAWDKIILLACYENEHRRLLPQVYCIVCLFTVAVLDNNGYGIANAT